MASASGSSSSSGLHFLNSPFGDTTFTKVFVGGLAWETQSEALRRHFERFGDILEAVVITDKNTGRSKGYGFVTFRDPESARRACADPSAIIDGRRANCNLASLGRPRLVTPYATHLMDLTTSIHRMSIIHIWDSNMFKYMVFLVPRIQPLTHMARWGSRFPLGMVILQFKATQCLVINLCNLVDQILMAWQLHLGLILLHHILQELQHHFQLIHSLLFLPIHHISLRAVAQTKHQVERSIRMNILRYKFCFVTHVSIVSYTSLAGILRLQQD